MNQQEAGYAARATVWIESGDVTVDLATSAIERIIVQLKHPSTPKEKLDDIQNALIILREWVSENIDPELLDVQDAETLKITAAEIIRETEVDFINSNLRYEAPEIAEPLTGTARTQKLAELLKQCSLISRGVHNLNHVQPRKDKCLNRISQMV